MLVREFIADALGEIGALGVAQTLQDEDALKGLRYVRAMQDAFNADALCLFTELRSTYALTANQQTRTIGPGGNFNGTRPLWIPSDGNQILPVGTTAWLPLHAFSRKEWGEIALKTLTDQYPQAFLYEPTFSGAGLGLFTFWPIPTTAATFAFMNPVPLTAMAALDTNITFPPGYEEMYRLQLAKRLCRPWSRTLTPDLKADADEALGRIKRVNDPGPPPSRSDPALVGGGGWDIRSGRWLY